MGKRKFYNILTFPDMYKVAVLTKMRKFATKELPTNYYVNKTFTFHEEKNRRKLVFEKTAPINKYKNFINISYPILWEQQNITNLSLSNKIFKTKLKREIIEEYDSVCSKKKCYICRNS